MTYNRDLYSLYSKKREMLVIVSLLLTPCSFLVIIQVHSKNLW